MDLHSNFIIIFLIETLSIYPAKIINWKFTLLLFQVLNLYVSS